MDESRPRFRRVGERAIVKALLSLIAFMFIVIVVFGTYIVTTTGHVEDNTVSIRDAGYQTCVRGNGLRAEEQFRASLTPKAVIKNLARQFHISDKVVDQTSIDALQKRLPIYDCSPLLSNKPAIVLSPHQQDRYVKRYASGKEPVPAPQP